MGGIGAGIFLLVVGGILGFAVDADVVSGINLNIVGFVCIAAGALSLVIGIVQMSQGSKRTDRVEYVDERRPRDYPPGR
ncbi:DUF6458 family protein [Pseudokineococcus basanitobsidens]|uniref:DUF6458 family protein n=1 Tax=Pseudokineococcus basanitobsidens TaxID=1926649 RepID=A0ABU8RGB0_9ACTN